MNKKNIKAALFVLVPIILIISGWFIFDVNSEIDLQLHPEKYSFKINFAKHIIENDYYIGQNNPYGKSTYGRLKDIDRKYKTDNSQNGRKIIQYNNSAFDLYYDILLGKQSKKSIVNVNDEDFILLNEYDNQLYPILSRLNNLVVELEPKSILKDELKTRKDAIKEIRKDIKKKKIKANVTLSNINFENLTPEYLNGMVAPAYAQEFAYYLIDAMSNEQKLIKQKYSNDLKQMRAKKLDKLAALKLITNIEDENNKALWKIIDNIDVSWKHRYLIILEEKNNIYHMYEIYLVKEGNRYYWNLQYYSPNSEFLKAYLKMLELLMNL